MTNDDKPASPAAATDVPSTTAPVTASSPKDLTSPTSPIAASPPKDLPSPTKSASSKAATADAASPTAPAGTIADNEADIPEAILPEVEEHFEGDDPILETSASSTASLRSSIFHFQERYGRRFHAEVGTADYWGANDEAQAESEELVHNAMFLVLGRRNFYAPINTDEIHKVIDIGTGTGLWAIEFADDYPAVKVIGVDISPIQTTWIPPNVEFQIDDCTRKWTFDPNSVEYIHMRWLLGSIRDWTALYQEAFRTLKPGGFLESQETSALVRGVEEGSALDRWGKIFIEAGARNGQPFDIYETRVQEFAMREAGFVDIGVHELVVPVGSWPRDRDLKEAGALHKEAFRRDVEGYLIASAEASGWSQEETLIYSALIRKELRDPRTTPYSRRRIVWGRKPFSS